MMDQSALLKYKFKTYICGKRERKKEREIDRRMEKRREITEAVGGVGK